MMVVMQLHDKKVAIMKIADQFECWARVVIKNATALKR
jgi:hypothetical protein